MPGKVLVSGATGFIASHIINQLLKRGYHVVGTVRSLANKERHAFLFELPHAKERLQLREADLLDDSSWDTALSGVASVIHVASPFPPSVPKHEDELIKPAVEGTRSIINACLKNKIKRLVLTSSALSIIVRTDGKIASEQDWSEEKLLQGYPKSKYLAERLFWEEAEKHKDKLQFVSVLPSLVTGPAFTKQGTSSQAFIAQILNGGYPGVPTPSTHYVAVDVRDVAVVHVNALEYPEAKGRRYLASGFTVRTDEVFEILRTKYGGKFNIPINPIDAEGIKKSGHGPSLALLSYLGMKFAVDNSRSIKELGLKYRGAEESILEQAEKQIELGIVVPKN